LLSALSPLQKCFALWIITNEAGIGENIFDAEKERRRIVFSEVDINVPLDKMKDRLIKAKLISPNVDKPQPKKINTEKTEQTERGMLEKFSLTL